MNSNRAMIMIVGRLLSPITYASANGCYYRHVVTAFVAMIRISRA